MAEELLCRHCHARIAPDYSGAKCPICGARLDSRSISHAPPESSERAPASSRRKAWTIFGAIMAGMILLMSLMGYAGFVGVARIVADIISLLALAAILVFISRKTLLAAAQRGRSEIAKFALFSALIVVSVSVGVMAAAGAFILCATALVSVPAITLFCLVYVAVSMPRERTGTLGHYALVYVVVMFLVIWFWAYSSFKYSSTTPYDYGPFRGFGLVALILAGLVLALLALFKTPRASIARRRGLAALILFVAQTPVVVFIVYDNATYKYPGWCKTTVLGDTRNISSAIRQFRGQVHKSL